MFKISDLFKISDEFSNLLPKILSESAILTRDITAGLHSTRFSGKGEDFWQFREYRQDDNLTSIDWRKSAALNKVLVKEKENETAKVIYFYYDKTKSMSFKSSELYESKYYISVLLTLTLSRIFLKNRENIFHFKTTNSLIKCSHDLASFNESFLYQENENNYPNPSLIKNNSLVFIFSDFLYESAVLENFILKLKKKNIRGYLLQILDPMEVDFTIKDNFIFNDMETNAQLRIDDSDRTKQVYNENLSKLKNNLLTLCNGTNWNYFLHKTDEDMKPFILKIIKNIKLQKN